MFKVGIIGLGIISKSHFDAYSKIQMADIVAVSDISESNYTDAMKEKGIRFYKDYKEMIDTEKLDMVDICLPTFLHKDAAVYALKKDLNVLVEKPLALNEEETEKIKKVEAKSRGRIMTAHVSRFKPQSLLLKKYIDSGELGKPVFFHAWRYSSNPEERFDNWLLDPKRGGGSIFDFQIHDIDLACWYMGEPIEFHAEKKAGNKDNELGFFISNMRFKNGTSAMLEISHVMPDKYSFTSGMKMIFEKGEIETNFRSDEEGFFNVMTSDSVTKFKYSQIPVEFCRQPYGEEIAHFITSIQKGKPFLIDTDQSATAVRAANKLVESLEK